MIDSQIGNPVPSLNCFSKGVLNTFLGKGLCEVLTANAGRVMAELAGGAGINALLLGGVSRFSGSQRQNAPASGEERT